MKKLFIAFSIAAMSFTFTACGDSVEKLVDDTAKLSMDCFTGKIVTIKPPAVLSDQGDGFIQTIPTCPLDLLQKLTTYVKMI